MSFIFDTEIYHTNFNLSKYSTRLCSNRRMQRGARSCFAPSTERECTSVHDRSSAEARREIDHDAPPRHRFFTKNGTLPVKKLRRYMCQTGVDFSYPVGIRHSAHCRLIMPQDLPFPCCGVFPGAAGFFEQFFRP